MDTTLNIGSSSIKVLAVKGRQVKKWGSQPLGEGWVRDGLILQPEAVGQAIDSLFKTTKIPKESVIISLSGLSFTSRFLKLPRMKPALLEEAIVRAAKKEISLPLEELYLSWQPIGRQGEETTYFVLGVPRNLIDALIPTLATAGLAPYLVDLKPLALARAAHRGQAIIANLEPDSFDIVLVAQGIPAIMHTISPRGEGATLEENIRRLTDEIAKTVGFYQSTHPENPLSPATPLLLAGELAAEPATVALIQSEIEYPTEALAPPLESPPDFPAASYAANMGLALKKIAPKAAAKGEEPRFYDININLLSGKYRKPKAKPLPPGRILLITFLIVAIGLLFPIYQAKSQLNTELTQLQDELNRVSRELNLAILAAEEDSSTEATIQATAAKAEAIGQGLKGLLGARGSFAGNLVSVTGAMPPQAHFTSIAMEGRQITIQGETDSPFTVVSYAEALEAIEGFAKVRIKDIDEASHPVEGTETPPAAEQVIAFDIVMEK
jgi:type IV pilus assembly protein PilM